jgi:hypothetical protein
MPRIDDDCLQCVIYLYPSAADAKQGTHAGGSGVILGIRSGVGGRDHIYAVTNSYVIREGRSPVIRLNRKDGGFEILDLNQQDWVDHADSGDLSICALDIPIAVGYTAIPDTLLCDHEHIRKYNIGPGDEVFMTGRFVNHEGRQKNLPMVRFGNISMLPLEPVSRFSVKWKASVFR